VNAFSTSKISRGREIMAKKNEDREEWNMNHYYKNGLI